MTLEQLSWYVDNQVIKRLLQIEGIAAVMRGGGVDREIRVILDPARLQGYGIAAAQVNMQLRQLNANQAGGRAEVAGAEQSMPVPGNAPSAYALGQTQISLPDGRTRSEARRVGTSVSVRVGLGGPRIHKNKTTHRTRHNIRPKKKP